MKKTILCLAMAIIALSSPVLAKKGKKGCSPATFDASTESTNTNRAPDPQSNCVPRSQTGSGQETGGPARERIPSR